ncbi:MAG: HIT family hydrolase, partial [Rothia dentocariosa]
LPRWSGDTNFLPIIAHTKTMSRTLDDMRQIIADGFARMPS